MERMKLGKRVIEGLPLPTEGRRYIHDTEISSLALCITPSGRRSFYVIRRTTGTGTRFRIGGYPELSVEQARKRAVEMSLRIVDGLDPQEEKRRRREIPTLQDLVDLWLQHAQGRKRTWQQDQYQYQRFLAGWSSRKLNTLRRAEIADLIAGIGKAHGIYTANRLLALLRAVLNHGIRLLELDQTNPAAAVTAFKEQSRNRRLQPAEVPALFTAVDQEPNPDIRDYVLLSLLTGARKSNVLAMRWDEVELDQRLWVVPAAKSKNGQALYQPLSEEAMLILRRRRDHIGSEGFVFPGPGVTGHLQDPKAGWKRICQRAGLVDLRLHDLRRSLASFMIDQGSSLEIVGKTLGHQSAETTRVYARLALDPVRQAVEQAGRQITTLGRPVSEPNSEEEQTDGQA
jgi:integrase